MVKTGHREELGPGDAGMPSLLNADPRPSPKSPRLPALPVSCVARGLNAPRGPLNAACLPKPTLAIPYLVCLLLSAQCLQQLPPCEGRVAGP